MIFQNLPQPTTLLIGRQQDVRTVCALLQRPQVRLLTFTGAPGVGKTRLCLEVAREVASQQPERFPDGVYFVPLSAVLNSADNMTALANALIQSLGLRDAAGTSPVSQLQNSLRNLNLLLVLDNFEQLLSAATLLSEILAQAAGITLLVTSRIALRLSSEYEYPVAPLALPQADQSGTMEISQAPSVSLFVARAQAVKADFQLTPANAAVVAEICRRLEGIPLAIELAAARSKLLAPSALLARLNNRLATLTSGARDLPIRQQTLRAALDWSYDLLPPSEQRLLRRASIFVGGWTMDAAEVVLDHENVLDGLAALLDHSLIQRSESTSGEVRFTMLELVREFAAEKLQMDMEKESVQARHAHFFLDWVESVEPHLYGAEQEQWLNLIEADHPNLKAVLDWSVAAQQFDLLLRLTLGLGQFWWRHGHFSEEQHWLTTCLRVATPLLDDVNHPQRQMIARFENKMAGVLYSAGAFAWHHGDPERADALCSKSLQLYRQLGANREIPRAIRILALSAIDRGAYLQARTLLDESLLLCRQQQDQRGIGWSLSFLGRVAAGLGELEEAQRMFNESLLLFRQLGEKDGIIYQLQYLSAVAIDQEKWIIARHLTDESLAMARQLGHKGGMADALCALGGIAIGQQQWTQAVDSLKEALATYQTLANFVGIANCFERLATLAAHLQEKEIANELSLASKEARQQITRSNSGATGVSGFQPDLLRLITQLDETIGKQNATTRLSSISTIPHNSTQTSPLTVSPATNFDLTQREIEVLRLIAQGLTYAEIATQLVVSPRTVDAHLRAIYSKLGVNSRHAATRFASDHQLI